MRISDWSSDVCSSDLLTAVENARDYCWAFTNSIRGGLTLYFPDGRYCLSGGIEFARSYFTVAVQSDQVWLESFRTTSGPAISCNRSEEHTSELQSLMRISYAVFCLKKKKKKNY